VALVDFDIWEPSLDMYLGLESRVVYNLGDLYRHRVQAKDVALPYEGIQGLTLIPGACRLQPTPSPLEAERVLGAIMGETGAECLVIDASREVASLLAPLVDCTIVVATPDALSIRSSASLVDLVGERATGDIRLVVNRMTQDAPYDLRTLIDRVGVPLLGVIPYDTALSSWQERGIPLHRGTDTYMGIGTYNIAMRLLGGHAPLLEGMGLNRHKWLGT
jgi:septum formation inhibitor-activating ATPase MinD